MSDVSQKSPDGQRLEDRAAEWVLRCDRGLTPAEQDELSEWLAADPRHGAELHRHRKHWRRLDKLVQWRPEHTGQPNPDLLAPQWHFPVMRYLRVAVPLAAAAAVVAFLFVRKPVVSESSASAPVVNVGVVTEGHRVLDDGSSIELNRGASVSVHYTATERRVRLERGEAHFAVTSDPLRPFIVTAGEIEVLAVGTAFNVRLDETVVEVLVTEGRVQVAETASNEELRPQEEVERPLIPSLEARQRAIVSIAMKHSPPEIATLTVGEIERVLAWQHRLLDFTAAPLSEVVAEFNRRNVVQLVIIDPGLASVRISASFRSDNLDGFLRLLEAGFGARAERRGEFEVLLRTAR